MKQFNSASALIALALVALAATASAECPHDWIPDNGFPGIDGSANASIVFDDGTGPALYVGGHANHAGRIKADGVVRWNGSTWQAVGHAFAQDISAFGIYKGALYAAGRDFMAIQGNAGRIARWDGHDWVAIGEFMQGPDRLIFMQAIAGYNGYLYVAGQFVGVEGVPAANIARWNGSQWSAVGGGISGGRVNALASFNGELFAAGRFTAAGGAPAQYLARWNGSNWSAPVSGFSEGGRISALATTNDGLIIGGDFTHPSNPGLRSIGLWNGTTLAPIGQGIPAPITAIRKMNNELFVAATNYVLRFDGSDWPPAGPGMSGPILSLAAFDSELIAVGEIYRGNHYVGALHWNGVAWRSLDNETHSWVAPLTVHNDELIGAGEFLTHDGAFYIDLARWDGNAWQPLTVNSGPVPNDTRFNAAISYNGDLIIAGRFTSLGGVPCANIAIWTGTQWIPLGAGVGGEIKSMIEYHGDLIVSGGFLTAGGAPANLIARWNGAVWSPLGGGLADMPIGLGIRNDQLLAANGNFSVNGPLIASWNGVAWTINPIDWGPILSFRVVGNTAYAGQDESGFLTTNVYAWDGADTSLIGQFAAPYDDGLVPSLSEFNGDLVASSNNPDIAGLNAGHIARWNGSAWSAFGSGLDNVARNIVPWGDSLFVSGNFATAGGQVTNGSARWAPIGPAIAQQPERESARTGQPAAFAVSSADATAFQWRHNGVALTDSGHITGATTANLTINSVALADGGQYDCILTNTCGNTTSAAAPLRVIATVPGKPTIQPIGQPAPG